MTPEALLDQIMSAARRALPRWVPRPIFDAYLKANRAALVARIARSPRFARVAGPLALGAAQELKEHPWAGPEIARRIAADHLRERPDYYGRAMLPAATPAAIEQTATRRALNERLVTANNERAALNRVRGPLGHGVLFHADKAKKMAALDAEIADLRSALAEHTDKVVDTTAVEVEKRRPQVPVVRGASPGRRRPPPRPARLP